MSVLGLGQNKRDPIGAAVDQREAATIAMASIFAFHPQSRGILGVPVMIWGDPGTGKSSLVEGLAQHIHDLVKKSPNEEKKFRRHMELVFGDNAPSEFAFSTVNAITPDIGKFAGYPMPPAPGNPFIARALPEWARDFLPKHKGGGGKWGVVVLGELSEASPTVQAAALEVVVGRRIDNETLQAVFLATGNPKEVNISGRNLPAALANRFVVLTIDPTSESYRDISAQGLSKGFDFLYKELRIPDPDRTVENFKKFAVILEAYFERFPGDAYEPPNRESQVYPTTRSWDMAMRVLSALEAMDPRDKTHYMELALQGTVGTKAAANFMNYYLGLKIPTPQELLSGEAQIPKELDAAIVSIRTTHSYVLERPSQEKILRLIDLFNELGKTYPDPAAREVKELLEEIKPKGSPIAEHVNIEQVVNRLSPDLVRFAEELTERLYREMFKKADIEGPA
jgi:GTPase SAR1 family protein